jgi:hypothetical protein
VERVLQDVRSRLTNLLGLENGDGPSSSKGSKKGTVPLPQRDSPLF